MIWNAQTAIELALAVLSLVLSLYGGTIAYRIYRQRRESQETKPSVEQLYYLLAAIAMVVLVARIANVPFFYWMVQSFAPAIPGAMCMFGVLAAAGWIGFVDVGAKLILPFVFGLWLILDQVNKRTPRLNLSQSLARLFLLACIPAVVIDTVLDIGFVTLLAPVPVTCCGSLYNADVVFQPLALLGPLGSTIVLAASLGVNTSLIAVEAAEARSSILPKVALVLTLISAPLFYLAVQESLAPLLMGMPAHHCPYCLLKRVPDAAFIVITYWVAVAAVGWRFLMRTMTRGVPEAALPVTLLDRILRLSSTGLMLYSVTSIAAHVVVATVL